MENRKRISLLVPLDVNANEITKLKVRKEGEPCSQEVAFDIQFEHDIRDAEIQTSQGIGQAQEEEPSNAHLMSCWEWSVETGLPIFPNPEQPYTRYVPEYFTTRERGGAEISELLSDALNQFDTGMKRNAASFRIRIGDGTGRPLNAERGLLTRVLSSDLKKIKIHGRISKNNSISLTVSKETYDLIPYSQHPSGSEPPLRTKPENGGNFGIEVMISLINENAKYGHMGPGTFWCRHPQCNNKDRVTASPVVEYGRNHRFYLNKRFTCASNNVVYLLHCNACAQLKTEEMESYSNHVGRTSDVHRRISKHLDPTQHNRPFIRLKNYSENDFRHFVENDEDPDEVRQCSNVHFGFEHVEGKSAARFTILDFANGNDAFNRNLEEQGKMLAGAYNYKGFGRGGLVRRGNS